MSQNDKVGAVVCLRKNPFLHLVRETYVSAQFDATCSHYVQLGVTLAVTIQYTVLSFGVPQ